MTITTEVDTTFESSSSTDPPTPTESISGTTTIDTVQTPIETSTPTDQHTTTNDAIISTGETTTQTAGTLTFRQCHAQT